MLKLSWFPFMFTDTNDPLTFESSLSWEWFLHINITDKKYWPLPSILCISHILSDAHMWKWGTFIHWFILLSVVGGHLTLACSMTLALFPDTYIHIHVVDVLRFYSWSCKFTCCFMCAFSHSSDMMQSPHLYINDILYASHLICIFMIYVP